MQTATTPTNPFAPRYTLYRPKSMLITVQQHILQQQEDQFPAARGNFSSLLSGMTLATKMIQAKIRRAGLVDILGSAGATNVQGETQQKLDVYANQAVCIAWGRAKASPSWSRKKTSSPSPSTAPRAANTSWSSIRSTDRRTSMSTSASAPFSPSCAVPRARTEKPPSAARMETGRRRLRGLRLLHHLRLHRRAWRLRLHARPRHRRVRAQLRQHEDAGAGQHLLRERSQRRQLSGILPNYLGRLRSRGYGSRYIGSLVADFHRTLLKGGVFLYPPTKKNPDGKLRLLYEANPLAFIAEQAGGQAISGKTRIMDIEPRAIHERTPLIIGSRTEVDEFHHIDTADRAAHSFRETAS